MLTEKYFYNQAPLTNPKLAMQPVKVVAVTGGKGGIGKTNIAINLAVSLASDLNVMLFDGNLGLSNIDVLLNLDNKWNISHVLTGEKNLNDIIMEGPAGIKIIPAASGVSRLTNLCKQELGGIIQAFNEIQIATDVLIIDTAPGISHEVMTFSRAANEVIVTICNDPTSLTDAYALIKIMHREYGISKFHIVANMVKSSYEGYELFTKLSLAAEKFLNVSLVYIGSIPYDELLRRSVQQRVALMHSYPSSPSALAIKNLGKKVQSWPVISSPQSHIGFFFERLFSFPYHLEGVA